MITHKLDNPYQCSSCNKTFKYKTPFLKHQRTHVTLDNPYQCSICNRTYSLKSSLVNHLKTHTVQTPYQCSDCDMLFRDKKALESHLKTHAGEKTYTCSVCNKDYFSYDSLMRHLKTHNEETRSNQDKMQKNLKRKRVEMYDAIKKRRKFECSFIENEVLDRGIEFRKKQYEHKRGPMCRICKESWFDAFKNPDGTICDRCYR